MCEIAVVDPDECGIGIIQQIAYRFNEEQGDGLGILAVKNDGDSFSYDTYKSVEPHWQTVYSFLRRNEDSTWRFVVHGRALTSGEVNRESAHPINVDCELCDFDYIIHNGSVRRYKTKQNTLKNRGHTLNTGVDTEVIAHEISEIPDGIESHSRNTYKLSGNLNYLVFSEDGILVRTSKKYHVDESFTMTCSRDSFDNPEQYGFVDNADIRWLLATPGEEQPTVETKEAPVGTASNQRVYNYNQGGYRNRSTSAHTTTTSNASESDAGDTVTVEYTELVPESDAVSAYKVMPGVVCVRDTVDDEQMFVYRDVEPRLYYWYVNEEPEISVEKLEEYAEDIDTTQATLAQLQQPSATSEVAREASKAATAHVLSETDSDITVGDAADIADDVYEYLEHGDEVLEATAE